MSPVKAENLARYPADWDAIALMCKEAAGWRCQCTGECGSGRSHMDEDGRCVNRHGEPIPWSPHKAKVILTLAHLDHTPENCADENLRVWCQLCHLVYDAPHHAASRLARAAAAREAAGQGLLNVPGR